MEKIPDTLLYLTEIVVINTIDNKMKNTMSDKVIQLKNLQIQPKYKV